jgi:hypothetical protein
MAGSPASTHWKNLGYGMRLHIEECDAGWRWHAWEQMTSTQARAEFFFQHLALLMLPHTGLDDA